MDLALLALFVAGLWLVRGFIGSVMAGDPFGEANVQRLRRLGFLLVIGAPAVAVLNSALAAALYNDLPLDRGGDLGVAGFSLPSGALVGGLGALVVLRRGVCLRVTATRGRRGDGLTCRPPRPLTTGSSSISTGCSRRAE